MDDWRFDILLKMLGMSFNSSTQTCKAETKNSKSKTQEFCSDVPKNEKELIYGVGPNSIPYEKVLKVTTYQHTLKSKEEEYADMVDTHMEALYNGSGHKNGHEDKKSEA